ncbi:MAG: ABC transporter permease subunit [Psychromonas sp.]
MGLNLSKTLLVNKKRALKDKLFTCSITTGGLLVLVTLLLIFVYLLYIILPIFYPAKIDLQANIPHYKSQNNLALGFQKQNTLAYQISDSGFLSFQSLTGKDQGKELLKQQVVNEYSAFSKATSSNSFLFADKQGQFIIFKPGFENSYIDNVAKTIPNIQYPLGKNKRQLDSKQQSISAVAFEMNQNATAIAAITEDHRLIFMLLTETDNSQSNQQKWLENSIELPISSNSVDQMMLSPDLKNLFVRSANIIDIYDLSDLDDVKIKSSLTFTTKVNDMQLLSGASSLIVAQDNGVVSQWFEVLKEEKRVFIRIREFQGSENITSIVAEKYRKVFYTIDQKGYLSAFHATSNTQLLHEKISTSKETQIMLSADATALLVADKNNLETYSIENPHPEITWSSLWYEIWYEDYPEPAYLWQSTSTSDEFEAKMSLIPITFGTIKAALYAMLIAVPIAISGAIYTAYFMSPSARSFIKPTIEIMEALPTVILGFLAGLWLAPIIENNLPGVILMAFGLPISVLFFALIWTTLPIKVKQLIPVGYHSLFLIPVILLVAYVSMNLSSPLEIWLFDGDARVFITNELGIDFNQRNALVIGIAMGFAVIPTIFTIAEDAIFSVPKSFTMGSLALGATEWQTLIKVVLLTASPGIFSAVMMGAGRAIGETMIVLMATGNTPIMDWNIFEGMRTLSATIAIEIPESEVGSSHYRVLFLAAFVLFIFTFLFNTIAELIRQRLRTKYSSL